MKEYNNHYTGKSLKQKVVLTHIGRPNPTTGQTFLLDERLESAVTRANGRQMVIVATRPVQPKNPTNMDWFLQIPDNDICGLVTEIELIKCQQYEGEAVIVGTIVPAGGRGFVLRDELMRSDPKISYFGMRTMLTKPWRQSLDGATKYGQVKDIVCWDLMPRR